MPSRSSPTTRIYRLQSNNPCEWMIFTYSFVRPLPKQGARCHSSKASTTRWLSHCLSHLIWRKYSIHLLAQLGPMTWTPLEGRHITRLLRFTWVFGPPGSLIAQCRMSFTPIAHWIFNMALALLHWASCGPVIVYIKPTFRIHLANTHEVKILS